MADNEVEELLQAAQDELLLKLSVKSHTSRSSPDYIDPDLHSRFLALKSKNKDQPRPKPKRVEETPTPTSTADDLMLRFAALKKTSSSPPSSSSSSSSSVFLQEDDQGGEDAEVEKLIQWAMDAARLHPSPPSDEDDDDDNDDEPRVVKKT